MPTSTLAAEERGDRAELILAQLESLPTLPAVATRVLNLTIASDSTAREVVRLIESDQSLSAKILMMARRGEHRLGHTVTTVAKAVLLLGFDAVRNAVLSIKVFETFARRSEDVDTDFDRTEFWKHSLAVACAAQLVAEQLSRRIESEQAFVCGLLHDIGKVALDACLPKSYDRIVRRVNSTRGCIADVEREFLGVDHAVVGHRLAQRWRFGTALCECIWLHHHGPSSLPASVRHADEVQIVHFADRLVRELRIGYSGNFDADEPAAALAEQIGLSAAQLERITEALAPRIEERADLIGLDTLTSHALYTRALASANDELSRTNSALASANQQLATRCRYFGALSAMNDRIAIATTHGEVCAAAAAALRTALEVPAAAVFVFSPTTGLAHVGLAGDGEGVPARSVAWSTETVSPPEEWAATGELGAVSFSPSTAAAANLAERVQSELGVLMPWFCPIPAERGAVAGALLAGSADAPSQWTGESAEIRSLLTAIRLWLSAVEAQHNDRRLNEDLAEINRRLQQAQREATRARSLAMIAEMAAGAAHELNNPLAVISGRSQMLTTAAPDEATRRTASVLAEQAQRCSQIVSELMEFARPSEPVRRSVSLGALLEHVRDTWLDRTSLRPEQFGLELSDDLPCVDVDAAQIESALDELIRNSTEAMRDRAPRLVVNCRWDPTDERVVVRLEDNGCGMDPQTLEHATDPFFSHRPAGRGRGLGLSRAARWIEINGGRLRLDSREGQGTTAFVEFPVSAASRGV